MISQTETSGGAGQYGFYAVPRAVEPKKKYRETENQYEDDEEQDDINPFATIDDKEAADQRELERDYYVDEAPYPEFKPKERGLDFGVQIERGDLFDFDLQVRPLIEIIVGRSVVCALNELQQEKQREDRRQNLDVYQKKRNAQLMVTQRLEAKHKRKQEQSERRRLQKDVYVKNQKQAGKKIIARKNAKQALLGFKNQLLNELEDAGYLRSEHTSDLKIKYEQWLYQQIMAALRFQQECEKTAQKLVAQQEKRIANEHQEAINKQLANRKAILDERARVEKENQQRKEKKRYRKWRQRLNNERNPDFIKFDELLEKYQQCNNILKFQERSNGFSAASASRQTIYIAGGLENFFLALVDASGKDLSARQIEEMLIKLISQSGKNIEISLSAAHFEKVQQVKKRMEEKKSEFMAEKEGQVKDLAQQISLDLSVLEAAGTSIRSNLHNRFIEAVLSIILTVQPQINEQNEGELNDIEKKRLQYVDRIILNRESAPFLQRLEGVNEILRVRFEILQSVPHSEASEKKQQGQQEEFVDIYDGQGWQRYAKTGKRPINRAEQSAAAITLAPFENTFVFDERVMHYLQLQLQKVFELEGGDKFRQYLSNLCNVRGRVKKQLPVYDNEIKWN